MIRYPSVKLNLGLRVLRKRPDGFHDLETLFIPYPGVHDTLEIITGDDYSRTLAGIRERYGGVQVAQAISADGRLMVTLARKEGIDWDPLKDLTVRAWEALAADFDLPPTKIFLEKEAPVGAGLGGGSSDAAATLQMLNDLFGLGLSTDALAAYAARLGSDCAFFVYGRPMFGEGRGEILTPFDIDLSAYYIRLVVPEGIAVSTAEAYRGIVPGIPEKPLREVLGQGIGTWKEELVNDFERTVFAVHPRLAELKQQLYEDGAVYAAMSGSGSALFGLFPG